jgi:hypothetical protein
VALGLKYKDKFIPLNNLDLIPPGVGYDPNTLDLLDSLSYLLS